MSLDWTELGATWWVPCEGCENWWNGWYDGNYVRSTTDTCWVTSIDQWFSWNVTADVKLFAEGTPNYGWFLKSTSMTGTDPRLRASIPTIRTTRTSHLISRCGCGLRRCPDSQDHLPADGSLVNHSPVIVTGTVSDPAAGLTVNGITASISGNTFEANIKLIEGQITSQLKLRTATARQPLTLSK